MKHVCVLGEGAWGTAIATVLAHNGHVVHLWCHDQTVANSIQNNRTNHRYAPDIQLYQNIIPYTDLATNFNEVSWIFQAIPVVYLRSVLKQFKPYFSPEQKWVLLSNGIEHSTLMLPSQIVNDVFGVTVSQAVLSGPSFAHDLICKQPTVVNCSATSTAIGVQVQDLLNNDYFKLVYSADMIGVQIGGALKNCVALGVGMLDGAGYTDNTKAFVITQGLHEIAAIVQAMHGQIETTYGLSGVGDIVLTAMGKHSKNYAVGRRLGKGETLQAIMNESHTVPEGINTVQSIMQLIKKYNLDLPLLRGVYQVIFEEKNLNVMLAELIQKP